MSYNAYIPYVQPHDIPYQGQSYSPQEPNAWSAQLPQPLSQYYSLVSPGVVQHKRPRRRYEDIERRYKCGWQGCEKAYGTLHHLNAHAHSQSHGMKRTPEEFKEMRNELKARKKDNQRKVEEELQRGVNGRSSNDYLSTDPAEAPLEQNHALSACPQLPPTDHASTIGQFPAQQMYQQDHRNESLDPTYLLQNVSAQWYYQAFQLPTQSSFR